MREVKEETGLTLTSYRFRGIVTFCLETGTADGSGLRELVEYMCLYTADGFTGTLKECNEGKLEWVDKDKIMGLELWKGDLLFLDYLRRGQPFFSLKLCYHENGQLYAATLDGRKLEVK